MNLYFIIGLIWLLLTEYNYKKQNIYLSNMARFRYFLLWPITLLAFIWGFIDAYINRNE